MNIGFFNSTISLFLVLVLVSPSSFAFESLEIEAGIEMPFQVATRAKANFNNEFYSTFGVGLSMDFLMGINSAMASGLGIVGEGTSEVIESALSNSVVFEVRGGWNLHRFNGLYVEAGYLYMMGGGKEVSVDQMEQAFGTRYTANPLMMSNQSQFNIASDLHALTLHAGYRWEINESWLISFDAGLIKPFLSTTDVTIENVFRGTGSSAQANEVAQALKSHVEKETDGVYLSQLFIPTASVWLSFVF